jgi:transcriptional regulator with XRE-family HTH domain
MNLIEAVRQEQANHNLNDTQLSKQLQIDLSTWSRIKRGICPPGAKFLRAVTTRFPHLSNHVIEYLADK